MYTLAHFNEHISLSRMAVSMARSTSKPIFFLEKWERIAPNSVIDGLRSLFATVGFVPYSVGSGAATRVM